ncbi:MAG TPA: hypothetical protein DIC51_03225 [Coxiellaceae bacterium]|nr:hypothetical protein [Coxiellaceae bacterium]
MVFLWEIIQENFSQKLLGKYDEDASPDRFLLRKGRRLLPDEFDKPAIVVFEGSKKTMSKYDCLPNTSSIPLVNYRIRKILEDLAPDDVQFLDAKVICTDGELDGYQLLNATHTIVGIDFEKSKYKKIPMPRNGFIYSWKYLTYKPGCMGVHHIARDQEYIGNLLVSETVKRVFDKEHITAGLIRPEEFYRPYTVDDLED